MCIVTFDIDMVLTIILLAQKHVKGVFERGKENVLWDKNSWSMKFATTFHALLVKNSNQNFQIHNLLKFLACPSNIPSVDGTTHDWDGSTVAPGTNIR